MPTSTRQSKSRNMRRLSKSGNDVALIRNSGISLLLLIATSASTADELPLFASNEPLDVVLEFPVETLRRQAAQRPVVDGTAIYTNANGETISLPVQVSTRGRSRLAICRFPPLSLTFKRKQVRDTVFEGQRRLKMVTHCRNTRSFRDYLLQEHGIYRALNELTDRSFRVRMLNVIYRDSDRTGAETSENAFLIESTGGMATRLDFERQRVPTIRIAQLDPTYTSIVSLFHFMIGNTDFSMLNGPDGEDCCHNGKAISPRKDDARWSVVPYDFDQAGLINTSYASPARELGIRSVRQRRYRGYCRYTDYVDEAIALFNSRRDLLAAALLPEGAAGNRSTARYLDGFYQIINNPRSRNAQIDNRCRGPAGGTLP